MTLDETSRRWVAALGAVGPERDGALARLHELLLRAARGEVARRAWQLRAGGAELEDIAYQATADAMVAILGKLEGFRGESRFTTWAYTFVMFEVSTKIGRHFWRRPAVPLDAEQWARLPGRIGLEPERQSEWRELVDVLRHTVEQDLTERQRRVFVAIVLDGVPLDALCIELRTGRGAIYKTLFDARRKIRGALVAKGYLDGEAVSYP